MIQNGANINYKTKDGWCAFFCACDWKKEKVKEVLLKKSNLDTSIKCDGETGLQHLRSEDKDMYDRIL